MDLPALFEVARITARVSALLFVAALFAIGCWRRVAPRLPFGLFAAFVVAHTVHFVIVLWLAVLTGGANFRSRGGYPLTITVGLLFVVGAVAGMLRLGTSTPTRAQRLSGDLGIGFIWFAFTAIYASRALASPAFGAATLVLVAAAVAWLNGLRRPTEAEASTASEVQQPRRATSQEVALSGRGGHRDQRSGS